MAEDHWRFHNKWPDPPMLQVMDVRAADADCLDGNPYIMRPHRFNNREIAEPEIPRLF
jgi:hypothetical protein